MKTFTTLLFLFCTSFLFAQTLPEIDTLIMGKMDSSLVPALAVGIIKEGKLVHLSANGYKDFAAKVPVDTNSAFHIASISKTVLCMAVFKLAETGTISIDGNINDYLPFRVTNPHHPEDVITVKDLLNHRSGIRDNYELYGPYWNEPKGDPDYELEVFLKDYLTPEGKLYRKSHYGIGDYRHEFKYCNTAYALLGLVIQHVSGQSLESYCQTQIFQPMGMNNTSWFLKHLDSTQVVKTYTYSIKKGFEFNGHNGYPDYPAGQLRTSISDYTRLLLGFLNAETKPFVLSPKSVIQITPFPTIAHNGFYTWYLIADQDNLYYTHSGGDIGVKAVVFMDVQRKNALVLFLNGEMFWGDLADRIMGSLFKS